MPTTAPQRPWSLRRVTLAAGVPRATARSVVRSGHLDPEHLGPVDVLVLQVAAMLPALQHLGEMRPANAVRTVPQRERKAVQLVRDKADTLGSEAALILTTELAMLAEDAAELKGMTALLTGSSEPFLVIPIGQMARKSLEPILEAA